MKINEIIVEATVGDYATAPLRTVGNFVKNVKSGLHGTGLQPGRNLKGQFTKVGPITRTAHGVAGGVRQAGLALEPIMPAATQYTKDIASAISTGASGGYYTQGATPTEYERAPIGFTIVDMNKQQWKKSAQGWINATSNRMASKLEAERLDRHYTKKLRELPIAQQTGLAKAPNLSAQVPLPKAQTQQVQKIRPGGPFSFAPEQPVIPPKRPRPNNVASINQARARQRAGAQQQTRQVAE